MTDTHFYLTLPSNSSRPYYGKQLPNNFTTKLDHAVALDPELWEVGLVQLSYTRSWPNVPDTAFYVQYPSFGGEESPFQNTSLFSEKDLGGIRYISGRHLVRDLQHDIRNMLPSKHVAAVKVKYDEVSRRTKFTIAKDFALWMHTPLAETLGLSSKVATPTVSHGRNGLLLPLLSNFGQGDEDVTTAPYTTSVDRRIQTLYVYCNIVQQQFVGDAYVQLLRTVDVPDEGGGERVTHKFTNVHYANLQTGNFEAIRISITDGRGKPVDFKHDNVIVKLHFRKKIR